MIKLVAAVLAATSLGACATITRGTTQAFEVKTTPGGAEVQTSNGLYCKTTPCVFPNVARNSNFTVTITKPGYKTVTTNVTNENRGGGTANLAGNILVGGLIGIGIGVDASNGSLQDPSRTRSKSCSNRKPRPPRPRLQPPSQRLLRPRPKGRAPEPSLYACLEERSPGGAHLRRTFVYKSSQPDELALAAPGNALDCRLVANGDAP